MSHVMFTANSCQLVNQHQRSCLPPESGDPFTKYWPAVGLIQMPVSYPYILIPTVLRLWGSTPRLKAT